MRKHYSWLNGKFFLAGLLFGVTISHATAQNTAPAWAMDDKPEQIKPYVGRFGLPAPYPQGGEIGGGVVGIDRWQANNFIVYRKETADFLYKDYTPLAVNYIKGTFPLYEKVVSDYTSGITSDREKATIFVTKALADLVPHPALPPLGKHVRVSRGLNDEDLLKSGSAWCNEQARVFVRMCQVANIPARMIFLFFADNVSGHVVAEFYADGHWSLADVSYYSVFQGEDGHFLSAAELHTAEGKAIAQKVYLAHLENALKMSDEKLGSPSARALILGIKDRLFELGTFGIVNYPLPE